MLGGAVLNASTFIGGSYLAKYLSGSKTDQERRRHDKALEKYQKDYAKYQENRQKLLDWQEQNRHEDAIASQNFENTDEALKLYNKFHPDENLQINEPVFSDYYRPSKIDAGIEEQRNEILRLEAENERIEKQLSLRDRVKAIFKKYGFTVFAVVSAVGLVIGVIVNNLKKGLTSLGKGVGGALKIIAKKIGEILPGMISAIASLVFKTAGEAVGFLAKIAWLLIFAAVMFMIEKFKKKEQVIIKMKFITVKSKQTTVSVDLVPPLVLGDKQRISLVDIRIPEQYFEFTKDQAIGDDGRYENQLKIIHFSKHHGKYNPRRLKQVLNGDPLKAELGLEIAITDKAAYLATQSKEVLVSPELTKKFDIPRELKPFSVVKISGDEKYFVYCDLVEENNNFLTLVWRKQLRKNNAIKTSCSCTKRRKRCLSRIINSSRQACNK